MTGAADRRVGSAAVRTAVGPTAAGKAVAGSAPPGTVSVVSDRALLARLLPTPFVASWVGRARDADRHDPDPQRRAAGWARWAVESFAEFSGLSDRSYVGLVLPGRFHDNGRSPVQVRPHLEVPKRTWDTADSDFPDRLAQAGNGLEFPWWVVSEVTAIRRAVFNVPRGPVTQLVAAVVSHRTSLVAAVRAMTETAGAAWSTVEEKLVADPASLLPYAVGDFSVDDVSAFFPPARALGLRVVYDAQLRDVNREWAVRRVGVWQLVTGADRPTAAFGVVTPRLTRNSLFSDDLFAPEVESAAALLVRGLLLRRLVGGLLNGLAAGPLHPDPDPGAPGGPYLRAVVARPGAKLPEASVAAAVHFLHTFPDADAAWDALQRWAGEDCQLTVARDGFLAAHRNALRFVRRAETPERDDINVLLPLAWDDKARVVRVTFSRPADPGDDAA